MAVETVIYPAPEPIPYRFTAADFGGNAELARKLNENFDAIERQLLALDYTNPLVTVPAR